MKPKLWPFIGKKIKAALTGEVKTQEGAPPHTPGPDAQGAWQGEDFSI